VHCARGAAGVVRPHALTPRARGASAEPPLIPRLSCLRRSGAVHVLLLVSFAVSAPARSTAAEHACDPPRTHVAVMPLVDATDHAWAAWSGADPAAIVLNLFADSLQKSRGRQVTVLAAARGGGVRPVEDAAAIAAARAAHAEVVVTGVVAEFSVEERREAGKFSRWGVSALDARARVRVRVALRVLDVQGSDVVLETTIDRERTGRATTSAGRSAGEPASGLLASTLEEVLRELVQSVDQRLDLRWQASVLGTEPGHCVLDAGAGRGLFVGQRLDVWRSGVETYDEDFVRVAEDLRVASIQVVALEGRGRARARVLEGEVSFGDRVRPCADSPAVATTARR